MGQIRLFWLCIGFLLMMSACETSLDFQPHFSPRLTIISQITLDGWYDGQRVYVYASQSPSDSSQFYTPANLEVFIKEKVSGISIQLFTTSEDGKIFFRIPDGFLKARLTYTISAHAPGFDDVQATTTIPSPSTISDLSIKKISIVQSQLNEEKTNIRYTLNFKINHYESNRYYHVVFYNGFVGLPQPVYINPELSDNQNFIHHHDYGVLIDREDLTPDQLLTFNFVDWTVIGYDLKNIFVELRSVTEEYYKYHSTLARQLNVRQDPFSEPVIIYNNIAGGFGNFSGFATSIISSDLPQ